MSDWTDESRKKLIAKYKEAEPTPETSTEIVADLAEEFGVTVNGARAILVRAEVYVKKVPTKKGSSTSSGEKKETKADSLTRLATIIADQGLEADDTVISKLTGKAAAYFADTFEKVINPED